MIPPGGSVATSCSASVCNRVLHWARWQPEPVLQGEKVLTEACLHELTFRFNHRTSASRGNLSYRLAQQVVQVPPTTYASLSHHNP